MRFYKIYIFYLLLMCFSPVLFLLILLKRDHREFDSKIIVRKYSCVYVRMCVLSYCVIFRCDDVQEIEHIDEMHCV